MLREKGVLPLSLSPLCNLSAASYRFPPYYSLHRHHPSILIDSSHPRIMAGRWVSHRHAPSLCPCARPSKICAPPDSIGCQVPINSLQRCTVHTSSSQRKSRSLLVSTFPEIGATHPPSIPSPTAGACCLLLLEHIAKPPRHQDVVCAFEFGCQHPPLSIKKQNSPSLLLNPRNKPTILPTPHNRINKPHHDGTSHHPRN